MNPSNLDSVERIARCVLSCLENELKNFACSAHEDFPNGCCDLASSILFDILQREGFNDFNLIKGTNIKDRDHLWVENDKYVIDLTSHQFDEFDVPLILITKDEYKLNKAPYYFITEVSHIGQWDFYDAFAPAFFESFYNDYYKKIQKHE